MRRVLIVGGHEDGDRRERDYLAEAAALPPEDVDRTGSTEDALRRLATGAYDLCIIDDRAGGTDGASLLREARARGISTPAVLMTGSAPVSSDVRYATVLSEAERRRYRAEDALLRSEERYRTLFDAVPVGLYRTASDRRIANANPAMAQMLGFDSVEELIGSDAVELYVEPGSAQGVGAPPGDGGPGPGLRGPAAPPGRQRALGAGERPRHPRRRGPHPPHRRARSRTSPSASRPSCGSGTARRSTACCSTPIPTRCG